MPIHLAKLARGKQLLALRLHLVPGPADAAGAPGPPPGSPRLNSSAITASVHSETLYEEFMQG